MLMWIAIALGAELQLSAPTAAEVAKVQALVGAAPLPEEWRLPAPASMTVADAVASLPVPTPDPDVPDAWGLKGSAKEWIRDHGPAIAVLAATPDEALPLLRERSGTLFVRALLRDPTAAEPVLGALHDATADHWGGGGCQLVYPEVAREALQALTGKPFAEAYPASPERVAELRRVAGQSVELPEPNARPGSAEAAWNRIALEHFNMCSPSAVADRLLIDLAPPKPR